MFTWTLEKPNTLETHYGNDHCNINFRYNNNSDVIRLNFLEEDLFDAETNNLLDSVVFMVDNNLEL